MNYTHTVCVCVRVYILKMIKIFGELVSEEKC